MARNPRVPDPSVRDPWIQAMIDKAALPMALMGGTDAMQAGGLKWLPQHPNEIEPDWDYRRKTARLRNYFKRTVQNTAGKLFAKPFQVADAIPIIQEVAYDVDREGTDIQAFARDLLVEALGTSGISLFLVDRDASPAATAQDDQRRATAPYWVRIPLVNWISLRSAMVNGQRQITHFRYFTVREKVINEFESEFVTQIRVVEPEGWRVYESQMVKRRATWVQVDQGLNTLGRVTLVPVYLSRIGFFEAENPLYDLADMNLEHFQLRSEQRRILQVNSFPMLVALNYDGDLANIVVGPNSITGLKSEKGGVDLKFVESQGRHMEAGRNEINDLVDQMRAFGAQFDKPGEIGTVESASGRVIDAKEATSMLQLWALSLKDSIEVGLYYTDLWLGGNGDMTRVGKVDMSLDFTTVLSDKQLEHVLKARQLGDISGPLHRRIMKQNSLIPEDVDEAQEAEQLEEEKADALIPPTGAPVNAG